MLVKETHETGVRSEQVRMAFPVARPRPAPDEQPDGTLPAGVHAFW